MELETFKSVNAITDRWPGVVEHDIEQSADFVDYFLRAGDEAYDLITELEGTHAELIDSLARDVSFNLHHGTEYTREELIGAVTEAIFSFEQGEVIDTILSGDDEQAKSDVERLLAKWPTEIAIRYSPSPLVPDGRSKYVPIKMVLGQRVDKPSKTDIVVDCGGEKRKLSDEIVNYVDKPPKKDELANAERIRSLAESVLDLDESYYEELRNTYGTKAAELFIFAEAVAKLRVASNGDRDIAEFTVPKFTAAPAALYKMYRSGDPRYEAYLEEIRQQAIGVTGGKYDPELYRPLVAVRSSAVFSEDGENASGAGIYDSVAVDPRDPTEFKKAVESVFDSLESTKAKAYLKDKGIDDELMGLLIQEYVEEISQGYKGEIAYGYIQSSDPQGRLIALSSETGEIVFDRQAVEQRFMSFPPFGREQPTFHYVPDHTTDIAGFAHEGALLANAALFAEKLFGKQVELEFAMDGSNNAFVLQVRPLPRQEISEEVVFPNDIEPILECRAIGVGDIVVTLRDNDAYEEGEQIIDWIDYEKYWGEKTYRLPTNAVFIIGHNDGYSGHVQMLARERGQICLYPDAKTSLPSKIEQELSTDYNLNRIRKFRVVSDGYRGAIYPVLEGRSELLYRLASGISQIIIK